MRVILRRISSVLDAHLLPGQSGFRPGRSTVQNVSVVNALLHTARSRQNYDLQLLFIDFAKAFDSVSRRKLRALLEWWGVPSNLLDVIFHYWEEVRLFLSCDGVVDSEALATFAGVLQGDPLSPYLFNVCVDFILRQLPSEEGIDVSNDVRVQRGEYIRHKLTALAYADDIVIFAPSTEASCTSLRRMQPCLV